MARVKRKYNKVTKLPKVPATGSLTKAELIEKLNINNRDYFLMQQATRAKLHELYPQLEKNNRDAYWYPMKIGIVESELVRLFPIFRRPEHRAYVNGFIQKFWNTERFYFVPGKLQSADEHDNQGIIDRRDWRWVVGITN